MINAIGYATKSAHGKLKPFEFERAEPKSNEVEIDVLFCGVCHSDIHQARNEWKNTVYPCLPGHEITGTVSKVGTSVKKFKTGDIVGVGCMIDSCHECDNCKQGNENYCEKGFLATYNGNIRNPSEENNTFGGYSNKMVVREDFVLKIPSSLGPAEAAPIMCAGVTTYSPLKHWNVGKGSKVGVVGLGGLGHMATKIAVAMGAEVTVISTTPEKKEDALSYGARKFVVSDDNKDMKENEKSLDFILSTIPESHDVNVYFPLLKTNGILAIVGCIAPTKKPVDLSEIIMDRKSLATSLIGSIRETQEVLDFCAAHKIAPVIKKIEAEQINDAFDKVNDKKADFRYVIDMSTLAPNRTSSL